MHKQKAAIFKISFSIFPFHISSQHHIVEWTMIVCVIFSVYNSWAGWQEWGPTCNSAHHRGGSETQTEIPGGHIFHAIHTSKTLCLSWNTELFWIKYFSFHICGLREESPENTFIQPSFLLGQLLTLAGWSKWRPVYMKSCVVHSTHIPPPPPTLPPTPAPPDSTGQAHLKF